MAKPTMSRNFAAKVLKKRRAGDKAHKLKTGSSMEGRSPARRGFRSELKKLITEPKKK